MKNNLTILLTIFLGISMNTSHAHAASLIEKLIPYHEGGKDYEGFVVFPANASGSNPGVLVIHNWMGLTDETKSKARALAQLGYVAFAADIYGKLNRPKDVSEAGKTATYFKSNRKVYREALNLGLKELTKLKGVDPKKLAVIGYCFGGTGAIELARSGADIKGAVSFHGGLDSPEPALGKNIKAKIIAFHGADDPFVPAKDVTAFEDEMRAHKVDWQLIKFGNTVHSFTEKASGNDNSKGAAYNERSDERSWQEMARFLKEVI